ncbi:MAG: NDP-sugar synthase [Clostridia bacterium]|nr:NDP-sugar synthase [Clostridia bacterium]
MNLSEKRKFDSVILAGGFGKRLSPLTDKTPKPLLPVNGESPYLRSIKLLRKHGFESTAVTTMYLAEQIEAISFDQGCLEHFREETPLGSAGAVGRIKNRAQDCVIVISGDAVCDFDLAKAKAEFLESGCDAAMLLTKSNELGEYGTVCVDNGRITQFCEKPSARDTVSNLINTGIYFLSKRALELIPEKEFFDFSLDLFPLMLNRGMPIAGIIPQGNWFDIGSFGDFHKCCMWLSDGKNCIGERVSVHPEARIERAVIFDNCTVGNSVLRGCIVADGAVIGNDCIIPSGCVIGSGAEIRDGTALAPGSVIARGDTVKGEAFENYFPKPRQAFDFEDDCVIADNKDEGYFVRLGRLLSGEGTVIAFAEGGGATLQQACELACGAAKGGSACTVISGGNSALAAFAAREYGSRVAFIACRGEKTEIRLFSGFGMPFSRQELRALAMKTPKYYGVSGSVYLLPHGVIIKKYVNFLRKNALIPKSIKVGDGIENKLMREICEELGILSQESDVTFFSSADGEKAFATTDDGQEISYWQLVTLCCVKGDKKEIVLPRDTPNAVERILNHNGVSTLFYGDSDSPQRKAARQEFLHRDGIVLSLTAAALAQEKGFDIKQYAKQVAPFAVMTRMIYADRDKMYEVISNLRSGNSRNAFLDFGEGRVSVFASAAGRFRLVAEAVDSETAEEISLRAIDILNKD